MVMEKEEKNMKKGVLFTIFDARYEGSKMYGGKC